MDGVLIDSEPWWREAMAEVYACAGIPYSAQQAVKTQGMRIGDIARKTLEEHPVEGWDARRLEESVCERVSELVVAHGNRPHPRFRFPRRTQIGLGDLYAPEGG